MLESPDGVSVPLEMYERRGGRAHRAGGHQPRILHEWSRSRMSRRSRASRIAPARSAWWTATRRLGSCPSTSQALGRRLLPRRRAQVAARRDRRGLPVCPAGADTQPDSHGDGLVCASGRSSALIPARWSCTTTPAASRPGTPPLMPVYAQLGGLDMLEEIGMRGGRAPRPAALTEDLVAMATAARPHAKGGAARRGPERHRDAPLGWIPPPTCGGSPTRVHRATRGPAMCASRPTSITCPTITGPCWSA